MDLPVYTFLDEGEGNRVLVITDRVPNDDIEKGELLSQSGAGFILNKIVYDASAYSENAVEEVAFINYHEFRIHDLDQAMRSAAEADFQYRIESFIKRFKPDVIIAMGRDVVNALFNYNFEEDKVDPARYFGRLVPLPRSKELTGKNTNIIYTLGLFDFAPDIRFDRKEDDIKTLQSLASLSGIVLRHFEYAFRNKNIHSISKKPFITRYVDSLQKFDRMVRYLNKPGKVICFDTETESLARVNNKLLSIQFSCEPSNRPLPPEKQIAFFLPIEHPDSPFTKKDLQYIKRKIQMLFERGKYDYHIAQNSKFDLTQCASQLGVRYYCKDVYGVDNGEYALEENLKFISDKRMRHLGVSAYGLQGIANRYGWPEAYDNVGVKKADRTGFREMKAKDFLEYACLDVIIPLRLRAAQIKRAVYEGFDPLIFENAVTGILSDMENVFADMERNGNYVDIKYLDEAIRPNGVIDKMRASNIKKYKRSRAARNVNRKLLAAKGAPKKSLFGGTSLGTGKIPWEFNIKKEAEQQMLFFEELGLVPLKVGKKSGKNSINKQFLEEYGSLDDEGNPTPGYVAEVGWFNEMKKYSTLMTNFVKPINRQILVDPDAVDNRIRSNFSFRTIITGRSGSSQDKKRSVGLNFQNMPNHGNPAKAVKRLFTCREGHLLIKVDLSAHEVRNWSNISGDTVLAERFVVALNLGRKFVLERDPAKLEALVKDMKTKGDIHIQNCALFFNKWVDKSDPLRQQVKAVVFGVIYGKSAYGLAKDLKISDQEAQALIDKMFDSFKDGGEWLQNVIKQARREHIIDTPFGLKRHLWGHYHPDEGVKRAMDRRGPNSVIQGVSSQMGYLAGRNLQHMKWKFLTSKDIHIGLQHNNSVHDSLELEDDILTIPLSTYLVRHAMTTQVARVCRERYNFPLKVDLDIEFEVGGTMSNMKTWNNRYDHLPEIVEDGIKWAQDNLGYKYPKNAMKDFSYNLDIIEKIRRKEIISDLKNKSYPSETMLLNDDWIKELRFKKGPAHAN